MNPFAAPEVIADIERELCTAPCGKLIASIPHSPRWMEHLGAIRLRRGLTNDVVVLVGVAEQLYLCDVSPLARVGETVHDPGFDDFPLRLYKAHTTSQSTWSCSCTSCPVPLSTETMSPSPRSSGGEGCS